MKYNEFVESTSLQDDDVLLIQEATTLGIKKVKLSTLKQYIGIKEVTPNQYYLHDTFTDTNGKSLSTHLMDIGDGWSTSDTNWKISNNKAVTGYAVGSGTLVHANSGFSNVEVKADITFVNQGVNSQQGLILRAIDSNNYLLLRYIFLANSFRITQTINGNQSDLVSASASVSNGSESILKFVASGDNLLGFLNDVQIINTATSILSTATRCG